MVTIENQKHPAVVLDDLSDKNIRKRLWAVRNSLPRVFYSPFLDNEGDPISVVIEPLERGPGVPDVTRYRIHDDGQIAGLLFSLGEERYSERFDPLRRALEAYGYQINMDEGLVCFNLPERGTEDAIRNFIKIIASVVTLVPFL